ncbi:MAG: FKBP-type peptidyl-prolyl cis-trans isomerase [Bacteroidetes bacterium]|nr:FKBP-type peptidyl-prolyl cis-trans isomerase [Bacteroidota bacterium]MCY4233368.1 FKBP-type peptidyl-prolyl cis-trans isomerase [Bacteroidota bacterium]
MNTIPLIKNTHLKMLPRLISFSVILILLFASCDSSSDTEIEEPEDQLIPRLVSEADYFDLGNGLKFHDFKVGTGDAALDGDLLSVHYSGWLTNNTLFDSSYPRNQPIQFRLGTGRVIQGWDRGLVGMKVGGERQLVIPPELAYGDQGSGPIPPGSTLIFEVQLVSID